MAGIGISHKAVAHLEAGIASGDTVISIHQTEYEPIFSAPENDVYLMLRGPVDRELIKIDLAASAWGSFLTIARGQGGTSAVAWPQGSMLFATTHEDHYNSILQRGIARTIDYNPNEILAPIYAGEKIYQDGPAGCERWWKSFNGVDPYWDIITGAPCQSEAYEDVGFDYDLLMPGEVWESHFDNTKWEQSAAEPYGVWNGGQQRWEAEYYNPLNDWLSLTPIGGWNVDYEPLAFRVTSPFQFTGGPPTNFTMYLKFGTYWWNIGVYNSGDAKTINPLNYSVNGDISGIRMLFATGGYEFRWATNIEFRIS